MRVLWVVLGGLIGLVVGAILGFAAAMAAMSLSAPHNDGTDGMREVLVGIPSGAVMGLLAGIVWGLNTSIAS